MWKHPCQTFDSSGRRCCNNQDCEKQLTQEQYKSVYTNTNTSTMETDTSALAPDSEAHECNTCTGPFSPADLVGCGMNNCTYTHWKPVVTPRLLGSLGVTTGKALDVKPPRSRR